MEDTATTSVLEVMEVVRENIMNMIFVIENTTLTGQTDQIGLKIENVIVTLFLVSKWRTMLEVGVAEEEAVWWSRDILCRVAGLSVRVMDGQRVRLCHMAVMAKPVVLVRGTVVQVARP